MTESGSKRTQLRGKRLHSELAPRVISRYASGHYEDAVLAAFKVVETRLRRITGKSDALMKDLLHDTLNPTAGTLQDPQAWRSEREGTFLLFKGAFQSFRDRRAHEFTNTDLEEAFDLIVLANRLLLLLEVGHQHVTQPSPTGRYSSLSQQLLYVDSSRSIRDDQVYERGRFILEPDNDGEPELLVEGQENYEVFKAFKYSEETIQQFDVERASQPFRTRDIVLSDVDNHGQQEILCISYGAYNNLVLFYKYQNGRYEILKQNTRNAENYGSTDHSFLAAHVADINSDGQVEVVSEPKPLGRIPPHDRYVWKWDENERHFALLYKEVLRRDEL